MNYNATKAWQRIFIESLALELFGTGVYVQALCPGYTHTEFHQRVGRRQDAYPWLVVDECRPRRCRVPEGPSSVASQSWLCPEPGYKLAVFAAKYLPGWVWRRLISTRRRMYDSGAPTP